MDKIKITIAGLGNCASSLIQGIHYYRDKNPEDAIGLMHWEVGGYRPCDIEIVAAFDIDMDLELRLSVEDSPNSAGVAIDAIPLEPIHLHLMVVHFVH